MSSIENLQRRIKDAALAPRERAEALRQLAQSKDPRALPVIREALDSPEPALRAAAAELAGQAGDAASLPRLIEMLNDPALSVRQAAEQAVEKLRTRETPGSPAPEPAREAEQAESGSRWPVYAVLVIVIAGIAVYLHYTKPRARRQALEPMVTTPGETPVAPKHGTPAAKPPENVPAPGATTEEPGPAATKPDAQKTEPPTVAESQRYKLEVPPADAKKISELSAKYYVNLEVLQFLWRIHWTTQDMENALTASTAYSKSLGWVVAMRKFPGYNDPKVVETVQTTLADANYWDKPAENLFKAYPEPMTWADVTKFLDLDKQYAGSAGANLQNLLAVRRKMAWSDIDTALKLCQQYAKSFDEIVALREKITWEELNESLSLEKKMGVSFQMIGELRQKFSLPTVEKILALGRESGAGTLKIAELLDKMNLDDLTSLIKAAAETKTALQTVLELKEGRDIAEITTLLEKASEWEVSVLRLAELRKEFGWEDLQRAQTIAQAKRQEGEHEFPIDLLTVVNIKRGQPAPAKPAEKERKEEVVQTALPLNWSEMETAVKLTRKYGGNLAEVAQMLALYDAPDVEKALTIAKQFDVKRKEVLELKVGRDWKDIEEFYTYRQKLAIPSDKLLDLRRAYSWADISKALALVEKYGKPPAAPAPAPQAKTTDTKPAQPARETPKAAPVLSVEEVFDLHKTLTFDDIDTLFSIAAQFDTAPANILKERGNRSWEEITRLLKSSREWKVDPKVLSSLRQRFDWDDIEACQKLAEKYGRDLEDILRNYRTNTDLAELTELFTLEQAAKISLAEIRKWRQWLPWDDIKKAYELSNDPAKGIRLDRIIPLRLQGMTWTEISEKL